MRKVKGERLKAKIKVALICFCAISFFSVSTCYCEDVQEMVAEGNKLVKEKKYDDALKIFVAARKVDPKSPLPNVALGIMFVQMGEVRDAEAYLKSAEEQAPELVAVHYTLALLYEKDRRPDEAAVYWRKLLNDPDLGDTAKRHMDFLGVKK
jgi:tetratricopeptide (TPR) repeat protein